MEFSESWIKHYTTSFYYSNLYKEKLNNFPKLESSGCYEAWGTAWFRIILLLYKEKREISQWGSTDCCAICVEEMLYV